MKVTYIYHSGFLVELETMYLLFDYFKRQLPPLQASKPLYVFASHAHQDHFNPKVYDITRDHGQVHYILSGDIKLTSWKCKKEHILEEDLERTSFMKAHEKKEFELAGTLVYVETFHSTDRGVAFLVQAQGKSIYHAGDLNWWIWEGESKSYNNNMTARFLKEMERLQERTVDVAFLPLDPRQERDYAKGMEKYRDTMDIRHVFPMHMWETYSIIEEYEKEYGVKRDRKLCKISHKGESFKIED